MKKRIWIGAMLVAVTSACLAQSAGEATFKAKCQMCHGATGAGDTPAGQALKAKSLSDPEIVKMSDDEIAANIKNGTGKMPPFKDKLTDDQIKDVLVYIRELEKK